MTTWKIGAVQITCIVERDLDGVLDLVLPQATPEAVAPMKWLQPHFVDDSGRPRGNVQAFVIEAQGRRIVVDTCVGNDKDFDLLMPVWSRQSLQFLDRLEGAGFAPATIDTVLCTHLHADHIGWNTRLVGNKWVPTFENARYLIARTEFEAEIERQRGAPPDDAMARGFSIVAAQSMRPVIDAGLMDLVETDHKLCDEVRLIPSHGHSPGHVSVAISSNGESALITGDFVHHPCQMGRPEWCSAFDHDPAQAIATRRRLFSDLVDGPTLVIGTHFAAPTAGRIVTDGAAYRLVV